MDIGFSRRAQKRPPTPVDQLHYLSLLAELAAIQAQSATAQAQSRIQSQHNSASLTGEDTDGHSFHAPTAALLSGGQE